MSDTTQDEITGLNDVSFSDLYLGKENSWLSGVPKTLDPIPAPNSCRDDLLELRKLCEEVKKVSKRLEFAVTHKDISYRVALLASVSEEVFVLRRFPKTVPGLEDIRIHKAYVEMLMKPRLSGLIMVAGAFGQGKTTTASAIVASRISKFGGIAVTIEDPPEMPLQGRRGEGVIYQRWVEQGEFAQESRQVARWAPSLIFIGEVRDPETATEALRASINGRLVICTIHSDSARTAVERLYSLANGAAGNSEDVSNLMASGIAAVVHQKLAGDPKSPVIEFLWLRGDDQEAKGAQNTIRQRRFTQLDNDIQFQKNQLLKARPVSASSN